MQHKNMKEIKFLNACQHFKINNINSHTDLFLHSHLYIYLFSFSFFSFSLSLSLFSLI